MFFVRESLEEALGNLSTNLLFRSKGFKGITNFESVSFLSNIYETELMITFPSGERGSSRDTRNVSAEV